jgi:hypothetical protein
MDRVIIKFGPKSPSSRTCFTVSLLPALLHLAVPFSAKENRNPLEEQAQYCIAIRYITGACREAVCLGAPLHFYWTAP